MKLLFLHVVKAETCGGLLDGLRVLFRDTDTDISIFDPQCLIGPNGTGKSQLLQVIAEIFQDIYQHYIPAEERGKSGQRLEYEIQYLLKPLGCDSTKHIRVSRLSNGTKKSFLTFEIKNGDDWVTLDLGDKGIVDCLPTKVIGYTSGNNETLSLPFLISREGYSREVSHNAKNDSLKNVKVADTRLMLIDYSTNLEVLVANLLLNPVEIRQGLLCDLNLKKLQSFRIIVQLKPSGPPSGGVKLTEELESYIERLKKCATTYTYEDKNKKIILDFLVTEVTHQAFAAYWDSALDLFSSFHKLSMLNDLVIPKSARQTFSKNINSRRFASKLPEPYEENKIFRFESVEFLSANNDSVVDYVSLSDGEHQLVQLLGTMCMTSFPNVLFLLDEPESHFNPKWRVEFASKILMLKTCGGTRSEKSEVSRQDCLITTHSPFVPSDMANKNVLIFSKNIDKDELDIRRPNIETYGSTFDAILEECFGIYPPMSDLPRREIEALLQSGNVTKIEEAINGLGDSVDRLYLADRVRQLKEKKRG